MCVYIKIYIYIYIYIHICWFSSHAAAGPFPWSRHPFSIGESDVIDGSMVAVPPHLPFQTGVHAATLSSEYE